jgi:hypothetical protein
MVCPSSWRMMFCIQEGAAHDATACARAVALDETPRVLLCPEEQIDDELIETLVCEATACQRGAVERLRLHGFGART